MSRRYDDNPLMNENNQGPSWKKVLGISLSIILAIVAIGVVVIYNIGHDLITRSNYKSDDEVKVVNELPQEAQETVSTEEKKGVVLNEEELNDIHEQMNNMNEVEAVSDDSVYNLLLVFVFPTLPTETNASVQPSLQSLGISSSSPITGTPK